MASPVGHAVAGLTVALAGSPLRTRRFLFLCMFLAAAPDLDYVYFPIHRGPTHSISAVILVTLTAAMVTRWRSGCVNWRVAGICGLAWLSHIVIDWLGQDLSLAPGLQVLWPWSDTLFLSGWDVFRRTERYDPLSFATMAHNAVTLAQEVAILGPLLLVAWWRTRRLRV